MTKYAVYSLILILGTVACNNHPIIDESKSISNRVWSNEQQPTFTVNIKDSLALYTIYLKIRHTSHYDYSNIFLLLHEKGDKLKDTSYLKEIKLSQTDGKWIGKSIASLYEVEYLAMYNFSFPDTGKYTFTIEQNMRDTQLEEIVDVGIKILKQ